MAVGPSKISLGDKRVNALCQASRRERADRFAVMVGGIVAGKAFRSRITLM